MKKEANFYQGVLQEKEKQIQALEAQLIDIQQENTVMEKKIHNLQDCVNSNNRHKEVSVLHRHIVIQSILLAYGYPYMLISLGCWSCVENETIYSGTGS